MSIWTTIKVCFYACESCGDRMRLATGASIAGREHVCLHGFSSQPDY